VLTAFHACQRLVQTPGGGEASLEAALEGLFISGPLDVLAIMIVVGAVTARCQDGQAGRLPSRARRWLSTISTPSDMCSAHALGNRFPILLAPLIAFSASGRDGPWGSMPRCPRNAPASLCGRRSRLSGGDVRAGGLRVQRSDASKARMQPHEFAYW